MKKLWEKKRTRKILILLFWLLVWQGVACYINNTILMAGPVDVVQYLGKNIAEPVFWKTVLLSCLRMLTGFLLAACGALVAAVLSAKWNAFYEMLQPLVQGIKAVPVASVVVLLLLLSGSRGLSLYITFFMAFPILYQNVLSGIKNTDKELLEMAKVFEMPLSNKMKFLYVPQIMPFLLSGCKTAIGMSWKAGVAAEVIGTPDFSIGERIYMSKIHLDTAGLFAWTMVVVLLSVLFERIFMAVLTRAQRSLKCKCRKHSLEQRVDLKRQDVSKYRNGKAESEDIVLKNIQKCYADKEVFRDFNATFEAGGTYCVMGPSGSGKTTLFRLLLGVEKPQQGSISKKGNKIAVVFQEDRLCMQEDALTNVALVCGENKSKEEMISALETVLPQSEWDKKVAEYSGGMKRRVALVRAVLSDAPYIVLDEPFNGMDEDTKEKTVAFIKKYQNGRTLIVATHNEKDALLLQAQIIPIS